MLSKSKREFPCVTAYFDRHRKRRFRFRKKGFLTEIHSGYGSVEFRRNFEKALIGCKLQEIGAPATKRGTVNALVVSYYKSPEYISLSDCNKVTYR